MSAVGETRLTAALLLAFVIAVNAPYAALIALFGYDDILREAPGVVLTRFAAGGEALILAWAGFAFAALSFAPLATRIERAAGLVPGWSGPASALAQFAGLARWVFAVPVLATAYVQGDAATRAAAVASFQALHGYLGAGIGETLGQILLVVWTVRLAARFWTNGRRILAAIGAATVPLWIAGLTEPMATVIGRLPVIETTPFAFMGWELWLAAIGAVWLVESLRPARRAQPA